LRCKADQHHGLLIFCLVHFTAWHFHYAKSKRPLPTAQGHHVLPRFRPKLGDDEGSPSQTLPGREGLKDTAAAWLQQSGNY
jgi:hypothetical protein